MSIFIDVLFCFLAYGLGIEEILYDCQPMRWAQRKFCAVPGQWVGHREDFVWFTARALGIEGILLSFKPVAKCNLGTDRFLHRSCLINQAKEE